jgi:hypothetical protein
VILTDEDTDDGDLARMVEIRQRMLDAVGGDLGRLLVLAIAGGMGTFEAPETTCLGVYGYAAPGRRIASIVRSFRERGLFQNLCEGDLPATFIDVLDDVVSACRPTSPSADRRRPDPNERKTRGTAFRRTRALVKEWRPAVKPAGPEAVP